MGVEFFTILEDFENRFYSVMFQVTFSEQSLSILDELTRAEQLKIIESMSLLGNDLASGKNTNVGKFNRSGKEIYRLRYEELRIYFEKSGSALHCVYILPKHSVQDFLIRCKLPSSDEAVLEKHKSFWEYLDSLTRK